MRDKKVKGRQRSEGETKKLRRGKQGKERQRREGEVQK